MEQKWSEEWKNPLPREENSHSKPRTFEKHGSLAKVEMIHSIQPRMDRIAN